MRKVFISFDRVSDQKYKDSLVSWAQMNKVFVDGTAEMGEVSKRWGDKRVGEFLRDEHLADTEVTILLVGAETRKRRNVDMELYASMCDGKVNRKSGVIVIMLPYSERAYYLCAHENEEEFYAEEKNDWPEISTWDEYKKRFPYIPERIIDNIVVPEAQISVVNWSKVTPERLRIMIENAVGCSEGCAYDTSRPILKKDIW